MMSRSAPSSPAAARSPGSRLAARWYRLMFFTIRSCAQSQPATQTSGMTLLFLICVQGTA